MSAEWMAISNELAQATELAGAHAVAVHSEARGSSSGVIWPVSGSTSTSIL